MKLTFLGGADEVGASCTLVEIAGKRILVDCGIRMNPRDGDSLPWLAPIQEGGGLDAIILTHAHMDHLGAMPIIHQSYPNVPIYMTPPTVALSQILLLDSLKIMQGNYEREGDIPLYPPNAAEGLLQQARPVHMKQELRLFDGKLSVFFFPAGHILGAACVYLVSKEGSILMGGDISCTDQLTIPGLELPKIRPDVVVMESTYGGRLHANRKAEETRIIQQVQKVLEQKGAILFPAFAIGRAQEVILILSRAMEKKQIPEAPIFIDGMVKQVCGIYRSFPEYLTSWMKKRTERLSDPFFFEKGAAIPVYSPQEREKAAKLRPAIFVSSSGMLTGGPSPFYASELAEHENCWIGITGYQDEEAPGRRIQEVFSAGGGELDLYGKRVKLRCGVGTYGLSAHADTSQIVSVLHALAPREIFLVHGDEKAREALQTALIQAGTENVHLPHIGEENELKGTGGGYLWRERRQHHPAYKAAAEKARTGRDAEIESGPLTHASLLPLSTLLLQRDGANRAYTATEAMEAWGYPPAAITKAEVERINELLRAPDAPFRADRTNKYLFRVRVFQNDPRTAIDKANEAFDHLEQAQAPSPPKSTLTKPSQTAHPSTPHEAPSQRHAPPTVRLPHNKRKTTAPASPLDTDHSDDLPSKPLPQARVLQIVDELFPPQTTLYKRSITPGLDCITLAFHFPHTAQRVYQTQLQQLRDRTRWAVQLRPQPHLQALQEKAIELLAGRWTFEGSIPVHLDRLAIVLPITVLPEQHEDFAAIQRQFTEETGFSLEAKDYAGLLPPSLSQILPPQEEELHGLPQALGAVRLAVAQKMEINAAYQYIRDAFTSLPHKPYKIGLKGGTFIELAFLTPKVGALYRNKLDQLQEEIGRLIRIYPQANQHELKGLARRLLPAPWNTFLAKEPQYAPGQDVIRIVMTNAPPPDIQTNAQKQFYEQTLFKLIFSLR